MPSGPPPPHEVTPTALIIFCFAPGLFSTTNFQRSPWRRARAGGEGAAKAILGPSGPAARQTFPDLPILQAGWKSALSPPPRGVAYGASQTCPERRVLVGEGRSHRPGDPRTTRLSLDPAAKLTDPGAWQVARVGALMPPPPPATHTHKHMPGEGEDSLMWAQERRADPSPLLPRAGRPVPPRGRRLLLA